MNITALIVGAAVVFLSACNPKPQHVEYPFDNLDIIALAHGHKVETNCSENIWDQQGRVWCFSSFDTKKEFMYNKDKVISEAKAALARLGT